MGPEDAMNLHDVYHIPASRMSSFTSSETLLMDLKDFHSIED